MNSLRLSDSVMQKLDEIRQGMVNVFSQSILDQDVAFAEMPGQCKGCSGSCKGSCKGNCDGACVLQ